MAQNASVSYMMEKINAIIESYPKGIAGFRRYVEIMDTEPDITDAPDAVEVEKLHGDIQYKGVTFSYDRESSILENIDLKIRAGETIAFVGTSGAGKTTLCSLLPRFYEIDGGSISIDGIDIRQMKSSSLRSQIGIVQQDVFLFSGTIRENIIYGNQTATEEEIAHRLATIKNADRIMVVTEDGISEQGSHDQLLKQEGIYSRLYQAQFGTFAEQSQTAFSS